MMAAGVRGRGRKREVEKVKWLGVVLDEDLTFTPHWEYQVSRARRLLGALKGVGGSVWGLSPNARHEAYTGMVRVVASWGVEVGWRGERE